MPMGPRAVALAALLVWGGGVGFAEKVGWVVPETLNVRKGPSTGTAKIAELTKGQKVTVTAFREGGWCRASLPGGKTGWVREEHLRFTKPEGKASGSGPSSGPTRVASKPAWVAVQMANLRRKASTGAEVAAQIRQGEKVYVVANDGSWMKVKSEGGKWGWVRADLLRFTAPGHGSSAGKHSGANPPAWVNANLANVRAGPSVGYSRSGQATRGTKVYILERMGGWVKAKAPDCTGWVQASLLETDPNRGKRTRSGSGSRDKAYCVGGKVYLRAAPNVQSNALTSVREGAPLWIKAEKDDWCKVQGADGAAGWIAGWYVRREGARQTVARNPDDDSDDTPEKPEFPAASRHVVGGKLEPFRAWICEDHTNVRHGPGVEKDVRMQLDKGTPVKVVGTEGQWCEIETDSGARGWTAGWVLDFQPPGKPEPTKSVRGGTHEAKVGWVNRPTVNLRKGPGVDAAVVKEVHFGEEMVIVGEEGDWFKAALSDGSVGWLAKNLVETRAERLAGSYDEGTPAGSRGSGRGASIVREAMKHLGQSYVHGASGPNSFDCSGFTSYVYRQFGIELARTCEGQCGQGTAIKCPEDLQPGDVVIFENTYRAGISHAGIYIGQGRFIHASNSRSGVKITDLDSSYYADRFVCGRRFQ